jgi:uncharacterized membrane protein
MIRPEFLQLVLAFGLASLSCRIGGFWVMRFVTLTPRIEAALKATPIAVMAGIVTPAAARGNLAELLALAVIGVVMRLTNNDLIAAVAGVAVIAVGRNLQLAA